MSSPMATIQSLGRALMLPIAVLPVAGLLLRLGQPDMLNIAFMANAGNAIFDNLGLLFAVGVATAFARDGNGAAALAGITCYLVTIKGAETLIVPPSGTGAGLAKDIAATVEAAWRTKSVHRFDVPVGIVAGLIGGNFYNRFATIKMPEYLAFFGGRRFVPIISGIAGLGLAALLGMAFGPVNAGIDAMSQGIVQAGGLGLFAFGVLNRLLVVTGLHHILNTVAYFVVGDYQGKTGDLTRFFAGDPTAGAFMSGFFPVMMFGLPAACLAMYHEALPERKKAVGGMLFSLALMSFLTGVTEPIEFSFMFLAPVLYAFHAVLTGLSEALMNALGVRLGYTFSAGLFDYVINFGKATKPLMLLPIGAAYALIYYAVFRFAIRRWNLQTPGREVEAAAEGEATEIAGGRGASFVAAMGGSTNLSEIAACTTRLRLIVVDPAQVDEPALKRLGARGILRPSASGVQVVLGPIADAVAMEMRAAVESGPIAATARAAASVTAAPVQEVAAKAQTSLSDTLVRAMGGADNIVSASHHAGRWRVVLVDPARQVGTAPGQARTIATVAPDIVHILID
ncbi:N-acetylglucosamine-specific PTS transporter subunit IIBC [Sphingomonas yabuuchiae]|uniref:PTS system N-acetylglucosamine-specific IIC component n=1 Tax=Sphingomonas yabuuchiae TaxID=172044 RepID=A0AA41A0Q3_9SPHN|nr:N-acetylglucosamine-specific PTS transporter subunit IIBC [Sphingomonas yabuuchiae]MBB4610050.1 PTS system N-acetylglucosamine-specific IIC component [Sphingomonas yabuuchiae]MBN3557873.1 PTS transporter subunit EIIC [Sphingomonas yabuuchiae]